MIGALAFTGSIISIVGLISVVSVRKYTFYDFLDIVVLALSLCAILTAFGFSIYGLVVLSMSLPVMILFCTMMTVLLYGIIYVTKCIKGLFEYYQADLKKWD